jgi:hypothetical protein
VLADAPERNARSAPLSSYLPSPVQRAGPLGVQRNSILRRARDARHVGGEESRACAASRHESPAVDVFFHEMQILLFILLSGEFRRRSALGRAVPQHGIAE